MGEAPPLDRYYATVERVGRWSYRVTLKMDKAVANWTRPASGDYGVRHVLGGQRAERCGARWARRRNRRLDREQAYGQRIVTEHDA